MPVGRVMAYALFGLLVLAGFQSIYVVEEQERAVILRLGKFNEEQQPGLNFKIPIIDEKFTEISIDESKDDDFIFDQDFNIESKKNSPGWKRLKDSINNNIEENIKTINLTENNTNFSVGETVKHEGFGSGKIIHIDGNKLLINFKNQGEKKVIDKFVIKAIND